MDAQDIVSMSREELARIYGRLIQGGEGDTAVGGWYRRKDGSRFPVEVFRRSVQSEGSHVIVAVVRDVTERRAAEESCAASAGDGQIGRHDRPDRSHDHALRRRERDRVQLARLFQGRAAPDGPQDGFPSAGRTSTVYDELIANPPAKRMRSCADEDHYVCKDQSCCRSNRRGMCCVPRTRPSAAISRISARDSPSRKSLVSGAVRRAYRSAQSQPVPGPPDAGHGARQAQRLADGGAVHRSGPVQAGQRHIGARRGDKLLKDAAERLRSCVRASDTVGRLGGDEFAAILSELGKAGDAGLVAQKIIDVFKRPFDLEGRKPMRRERRVTLYPADSDNAEALVVNADAAMYRAKQQGATTTSTSRAT